MAVALLFLLAVAFALLSQRGALAQARPRRAAVQPMVPTQRHPMQGSRFLTSDVPVRSLDGVTGFKSADTAQGRALVGGNNGANIAEKIVDITQHKTPDEITPFWTQDERYLYYASNQDPANPDQVRSSGKYGLFYISAAPPSITTQVAKPISITANDTQFDYKFPAIDASGSRIAFVRSSDGGATWNLYVSDLPAAGTLDTTINGPTNLRSLTYNATTNAPRKFVGQNFVSVGRPSWVGPSDLVFAAKVGSDTHYHLYAVNINADVNGNYTYQQLTGGSGDEQNPAVSPDGKEVAFDADAAGFATGQPRTELLPGNVPTNSTGADASGKRNIFVLLLANPFGGAANYSVVKITGQYSGATPTNNVEPAWSPIQNNPTLNPNGDTLFLAFASTRKAQFDTNDPTGTVVTGYTDGATYDIYSLMMATGANNANYAILTENALSGNGIGGANAAMRLDVGDPTYAYNDEYPTWSPFQTVQRVGLQSDRIGTYQANGFGTGFTSSNPAHDLFIATEIDITAPTLLRFDTGSGTGEVVHINPVTDAANPYNPNASVRNRDQGILPGSTLFFTVRVDDRESGMRPDKAVFLEFTNPNSKYQSQAQGGLGVEHKEFSGMLTNTSGAFLLVEGSPPTRLQYIDLTNNVEFGTEFEAEAISAADRTSYFRHKDNVLAGNQVLYTPVNDDSQAFSGVTHPPLDGSNGTPNVWLELKPLTHTDGNGNTVPTLPADGKGGILYGASWKIPDEASDWFINVILYDNAVNPFNVNQRSNFIIYDNVWGFSSALPLSSSPADILVVSDYALGQKFFGARFNTQFPTGSSNLGGPNFWGTESYFTDVDVAKFPTAGDQAPPSPGGTTPRIWDQIGPFVVSPTSGVNPGGLRGAVTIPNTLGVDAYVDELLAPAGSQVIDGKFLPAPDRYSIWRILARGPVPVSLLQSYLPTVVSAPRDTLVGETTDRSVQIYNRVVVWNSPLAGDLFVGPGTITDLDTQNNLTTFVKAGGRLFISGQDIAFALAGNGQANDFFTNTLQAQFVADSSDSQTIGVAAGSTATITHDAWTRAEHAYGGVIGNTIPYAGPDGFTMIVGVSGIIDPTGTDRGDTSFGASWRLGRNDVVAPVGTGKSEYTYAGGSAMISSAFGSGRVLYSAQGFESISNDWYTYSLGNTTFVATHGTRAKLMHNIVCSWRTSTINGRVLDNNGSPVAGVLVRAVPTVAAEAEPASGTATTDANGNYSIQGLLPDAYAIFAYKQGYFTQHQTAVPVHGAYQIAVNLALKAANPGALSGVSGSGGKKGGVFKADGVTPVPGVLIQVLHSDPQQPAGQPLVVVATTKSLSDGSYTIPSLPVDIDEGYEVIANPTGADHIDGYATVILKSPPQTETRLGPNTTVKPGKNPDGTDNPDLPGRLLIQENVTAQVDFLLPANPQSLSGEVDGQNPDGTNKAPLPGATVLIESTTLTPKVSVTMTTDANGKYDTATLPNGTGLLAADTYKITASKPGYDTQSLAAVSVGGPTPVVAPTITLTKLPPGTVVGSIVDTHGQPFPGATLTLQAIVAGQVTNAAGSDYPNLTNPVTSTSATGHNFEFDNVPPGTYQITASAPGYIVTPNPSAQFTVTTQTTTTVPTFRLSALNTYAPGIQLISTPNDYSAIDPRSLFGLTPGTADYNNFKVASWDPAGQAFTVGAATSLQPGVGYFVYFGSQAAVTQTGTQKIQGTDPNTYVLNLAQGWNLIGNPFGTISNPSVKTAVVDLRLNASFTYTMPGGAPVTKNMAGAAADGAVQSTAFSYTGSLNGSAYVQTTVLQPWYGYWLYASVPVTVTLNYPNPSDGRAALKSGESVPVGRAVSTAATTRAIVSNGPSDWRIQLAAQQGDLLDTDNSIGVAPDAKDGFDNRYDTLKPPAVSQAPSLYLSVVGKSADGKAVSALSDSIASASTAGTKTWEFTVQAQPGREVTVYWPNISRLPRNLSAVLVDEDTSQRVLMRGGASSFRYTPKGSADTSTGAVTHHFRVEVGPAASRPLALTNVTVTRTGAASGSGRGAGTAYRVRFTATAEADITAEIQTVAGRTLRSFQTRAVASQASEVVWDGRDNGGATLPTGAYVVNLTARDSSTGAIVKLRLPIMTVK